MKRDNRTYDPEKPDINVVRYTKNGKKFEVAVDPEEVFSYREGNVSIHEVLRSHRVFHDAKDGYEVFQSSLEEVFGTTDELEAADTILREGSVQLTPKHRQKLREQRKNALLDVIAKKAIDPRTDTPHPRRRLEKVFDTAGIHIDEFKPAPQQLHSVIEQLKEHLPISIEHRHITFETTTENAYKIRPKLESYGEIIEENWGETYTCVLRTPPGMQKELLETVNNITKGDVETRVSNT